MEPPDLKAIFSEALDREPGPPRSAYLDEACRGDAALRAQVEELLGPRSSRTLPRRRRPAARQRPGPRAAGDARPKRRPRRAPAPTGRPGAAPRPRADAAGRRSPRPRRPARRPRRGPGDRIGPYKLLQQIGEGGMGTVYMAEQTEPVQPQGRPEGHQAGHGHAARSSPGSRPSGRRWR